MQKIRVCTCVCDVSGGGAESVILNYFSKLDRSRYELDLLTYGISSENCANRFRDLGFNIIEIPPKKSGFIKSIHVMYKYIRNGKYDVVHAHLTEWNCIPMILSALSRVPIRISHAHTTKQIDTFKMNTLLVFQRILNRIFANVFCSCGEASAEYLYSTKMCDGGKVVILNNAIDLDVFTNSTVFRNEIRDQLGIDEGTFCLGHIGRFVPVKNHFFLIDIFCELHKLRPNSRLLLVGSGELEEAVASRVAEKGLTESVLFLGMRNDVNKIFCALDCFCLPSVSEGFPVVCVEAQACKVPIVTSDAVSNKVRLTDGLVQISLDCNSVKWAETILEHSKKKYCIELPIEYDINKAVCLWEKMYER